MANSRLRIARTAYVIVALGMLAALVVREVEVIQLRERLNAAEATAKAVQESAVIRMVEEAAADVRRREARSTHYALADEARPAADGTRDDNRRDADDGRTD